MTDMLAQASLAELTNLEILWEQTSCTADLWPCGVWNEQNHWQSRKPHQSGLAKVLFLEWNAQGWNLVTTS